MIEGLRWLGWAGFLLQGDKTVYIDPWSLPEGLPKADLIFLTHDHPGHCSPKDIAKISSLETVIAGPRDCVTRFKANQLPLSLGESRNVLGIRFSVIQAYNVSKPNHTREQAGFGYAIEILGTTIYHAGDTDHIPEMARVKADVALLPIGGGSVMDRAEALEAVKTLAPKLTVPMHYEPSGEGLEDARRFERDCRAAGFESLLLPTG
jgi:L-ascorbate metabolism protein UlaG (beta-lactamase superfamily)